MGLSLKAERLVEAVLDPKTASLTHAGKIAGYGTATSAHRAYRNAQTQEAIARRLREKSDKSKGLLGKFDRQLRKLSSRIDKFDDDDMQLTPAELMGTLKILQDLRKGELEIRERFPQLDPSSDDDAKTRAASWIQSYTATVLRCALDRPHVAARILARTATCCGESSPPVTVEVQAITSRSGNG